MSSKEGTPEKWREMWMTMHKICKKLDALEAKYLPPKHASKPLPKHLNTFKTPTNTYIPKPKHTFQNQTPNLPKPKPNILKCFKCQGFGHGATECPNKRVVTIKEGVATEVKETFEKKAFEVKESLMEEEEEEIIEADEGELLEIEEASMEEKIEDEPLETNETLMEENGKILNPIVDVGDCDNIVAKEEVEKLDLEVVVHPYLCPLTCIVKIHEVKVSPCYPIPFTISVGFKDKVWCDVVLFDACHILWEIPWQYGRQFVYDGSKHAYALKRNGENNILASLSPKSMKMIKKPLVECEKILEMSDVPLPLEGKIEECGREKLTCGSNKVIFLLNEFSNDYTNDISLGWPPDHKTQDTFNKSKPKSYTKENVERGQDPFPVGENDAGASSKIFGPRGTKWSGDWFVDRILI